MKIRVIDDLNPEDGAMLQALYSRSAESVDVHLEKVKKAGSGKFMDRYYVGYGHKSIADCGSTTVFTEDVSLLTAKAFQDWPLYSGQETSTRYIDMANQRIVDPVGTPESKKILDDWMSFYVGHQADVAATVRERHPMREGEKPEAYEGAVKARTFDILRGFLPAGITTQFSWHTNLRQAGDHLSWLLHHPASEISAAAVGVQLGLIQKYPSSGVGLNIGSGSGTGSDEEQEKREKWKAAVAKEYTYPPTYHQNYLVESTIDNEKLIRRYGGMLASRPKGCELPHFLSDLGQVRFNFLLDFGSHRDIQRHRNGVCRMPMLSTTYGFEPWYLEQLSDELRKEAEGLILQQTHATDEILDPVKRQYYIGLGFRVPSNLTYGLPAAVYVMELRSGKVIHSSLRKNIQAVISKFREIHPAVALHVDDSPDDWTVRRGTQTITEKR
jgi:hypothetical protein